MKGIMIYSNEITLKNAETTIKRLYKLNFTDVFYIAKNIDGKVYYSSEIAPSKNDNLRTICDIAKKYNINVYAWFCTLTEGYEGKLFGDGTSKFLLENKYLSSVNSELIDTFEKPVSCDQGLENYACPANPKVQEYELSLMKEIVNNYPIKGIHLDFMRYPFPGNYCYCNYCKKKFKKDIGISITDIRSEDYLTEWRNNIISDFVNEINKELKKINSKIKISALVWKYDDCIEKTQNWKNWEINFLTPMFYHKSYGKSIDWIGEEINRNKQISKKDIIAAIGGPFSDTFTHKEWNLIEKTVSSSNVEGILYGHYGLINVIETLEKEDIKSYFKKKLVWNIHRLKIKYFMFIIKLKEKKDQKCE